MEIWTQAYLETSRQTQLKLFLNDLHIILNGVVVMTQETFADGPGSNSFIVTIIFTQASTIYLLFT